MADGQTSDPIGNAGETLPIKFQDPNFTASGAARAHVDFRGLKTLWVNTGTLCNIECAHCYIESSPQNDRLEYLRASELEPILLEAKSMGASDIGFTGGEPFMNPDMGQMTDNALALGFSVLVLTNAMRPMQRPKVTAQLLDLHNRYKDQLRLRVSLDHYTAENHDRERTPGAFGEAMNGLDWLARHNFALSIAGRMFTEETETQLRKGFSSLFARAGIALDAQSSEDLVLFPEMDETASVAEITTECWSILNTDPGEVMCADARMLVKRKGAARPTVLACTLIPYDDGFEMGETLKDATASIKLNHRHCAEFCVLGGASCSPAGDR